MNPAPASRTSVSASSPTISTIVHQRARTPTAPVRPPSLRTSFTFVFETWSAGARPNSRPVARGDARQEGKDVSIVKWIQDGLPTSCVAASNSLTPTTDRP